MCKKDTSSIQNDIYLSQMMMLGSTSDHGEKIFSRVFGLQSGPRRKILQIVEGGGFSGSGLSWQGGAVWSISRQ